MQHDRHRLEQLAEQQNRPQKIVLNQNFAMQSRYEVRRMQIYPFALVEGSPYNLLLDLGEHTLGSSDGVVDVLLCVCKRHEACLVLGGSKVDSLLKHGTVPLGELRERQEVSMLVHAGTRAQASRCVGNFTCVR